MGGKDGPKDRLVRHRRLVSFVAGLVVYVAVLAAVSNPAETNYTTHAVRYLVLVALFYVFLSGVNVVYGYIAEGAFHEDAPDFVGGISVLVGLGVFYSEILGTAGIVADAATIAVLVFVTVTTVAGMLLILRF